nr:hypothetical protein [uncultured Albidiferax sp.]
MPEPTATAAVTFAATAAAVPVLTAFGVPLGLRADVLLAGFVGAGAAMVLLNTVPGTSDTIAQLLRTTVRRAFVALASSVTAGYLVPWLAENASITGLLFYSFVVGAGAQKVLAAAVAKLAEKTGAQP